MKPGRSGDAEDIAAIRSIYEWWRPDWEAGDAVAVAAYYTDDNVQMPIGEPDTVGRSAFVSGLQSLFAGAHVKGDHTDIKEVAIDGDTAFVRGHYALTVSPKDGSEPTHFRGKFMHILKRQSDGRWLIHRAIGGDES